MTPLIGALGPAPGAYIDIVDVFAQAPGQGNPVAVIYGCEGAPKDWRQQFARWIGVPETVFVTPAALRHGPHDIEIFAPACELAFAGHPAIGTVRSLLERALAAPEGGEVLLRCPAGLVSMQVEDESGIISFLTPRPARVEPVSDVLARLVDGALNASGALQHVVVVDTGARWIVAMIDAVEALYRLQPDMDRIARLSAEEGVSGVSVVAEEFLPDGTRVPELRSFAPVIGVPEDAVCGGGNACVAAALSALQGFAPASADYVARQGRALGRKGRIVVRGPSADRRFRIGGQAHRVISGDLRGAA